MNRVMIQDGYSLPFEGHKKRRKHRTAKQKAAQRRFAARAKACAKKWRKKSDKFRATHSYRAFQKRVC